MALQGAKMAKSGLEPGDDPHSFAPAVPGSHRGVRATPGALPTAAASMDGSDGRADGIPGGGKGLKN